jgi:hypothetical protein
MFTDGNQVDASQFLILVRLKNFCSVEKAPAPHRLPAARQRLTMAMQTGSRRAAQ